MRLMHVIPHVDAEHSGPSYSVPRLCQTMAESGHDLTLFSLKRGETQAAGAFTHQTFPETPQLGGVGLSHSLRRALDDTAGDVDLVHSHSLWMMPNVYPAWAAAQAGKPLVVSPRGTLSPVALSRSPRRKKWFWLLLQGPAVRRADMLHATSEQEYRDLRAYGLTQPVAVIPNGVDHPQVAPTRSAKGRRRRLLYVGRLHPIKGLDDLLDAWCAVSQRFEDWELRLVGPDEGGHEQRLRRRADTFDLTRLDFAGPRYGADKLAEYAAADLFVLPSRSENFGMSIAEALSSALPVVTTTGAPWAGLPSEGCGWWVSPDSGALAGALAEAMALDRAELARMGERGRAWMARDFAWERIGQDMEAAYRWLVGGGAVPPFVRLN